MSITLAQFRQEATMTPYAINKKLKKAGLNQSEIARRLGISRQMVNHVIVGRCKTAYVREIVAELLGLDVKQIWPPKRPRKAA